MDRTVVINATSIGESLDGIGAYGIHLLKALWQMPAAGPFTVFVTRAARPHFADTPTPPHVTLRWVSAGLSPDGGTRAHLLRWAYANFVAARHPRALVFSTSPIAAASFGGRSVVMVHDLIPLLFPRHHPRQRFFYRHVLGPALRRATAVVTPSASTRADLERHYGLDGGRIHVIPHGLTVPLAAPSVRSADASIRRPDGDPFLLCLGRLSPTKNVETLVRAYGRLEGQVPERLVVAGAGPLPGIPARRVTYLGAVSEARKLDLLDRASALVCPTLYEGFGLIPLEAMARGCPVVVSRVGSLPEVCGDAALYFDPVDVDGMAAATLRVLTDEPLRRDMVEEGGRRARALSWEASARRHLAVFEEALAVAPASLPAAAADFVP
jgi:alpha-1,3-rhamnosyl/mannosyltransferase